MKKRIAQSVGKGIMVTALGYAMKARPGPAEERGRGYEQKEGVGVGHH